MLSHNMKVVIKVKLKIKIPFTDKYNGTSYKTDEVVEFAENRAKELLSDKRCLVEKVEEKKRSKSEKQGD